VAAGGTGASSGKWNSYVNSTVAAMGTPWRRAGSKVNCLAAAVAASSKPWPAGDVTRTATT